MYDSYSDLSGTESDDSNVDQSINQSLIDRPINQKMNYQNFHAFTAPNMNPMNQTMSINQINQINAAFQQATNFAPMNLTINPALYNPHYNPAMNYPSPHGAYTPTHYAPAPPSGPYHPSMLHSTMNPHSARSNNNNTPRRRAPGAGRPWEATPEKLGKYAQLRSKMLGFQPITEALVESQFVKKDLILIGIVNKLGPTHKTKSELVSTICKLARNNQLVAVEQYMADEEYDHNSVSDENNQGHPQTKIEPKEVKEQPMQAPAVDVKNHFASNDFLRLPADHAALKPLLELAMVESANGPTAAPANGGQPNQLDQLLQAIEVDGKPATHRPSSKSPRSAKSSSSPRSKKSPKNSSPVIEPIKEPVEQSNGASHHTSADPTSDDEAGDETDGSGHSSDTSSNSDGSRIRRRRAYVRSGNDPIVKAREYAELHARLMDRLEHIHSTLSDPESTQLAPSLQPINQSIIAVLDREFTLMDLRKIVSAHRVSHFHKTKPDLLAPIFALVDSGSLMDPATYRDRLGVDASMMASAPVPEDPKKDKRSKRKRSASESDNEEPVFVSGVDAADEDSHSSLRVDVKPPVPPVVIDSPTEASRRRTNSKSSSNSARLHDEKTRRYAPVYEMLSQLNAAQLTISKFESLLLNRDELRAVLSFHRVGYYSMTKTELVKAVFDLIKSDQLLPPDEENPSVESSVGSAAKRRKTSEPEDLDVLSPRDLSSGTQMSPTHFLSTLSYYTDAYHKLVAMDWNDLTPELLQEHFAPSELHVLAAFNRSNPDQVQQTDDNNPAQYVLNLIQSSQLMRPEQYRT